MGETEKRGWLAPPSRGRPAVGLPGGLLPPGDHHSAEKELPGLNIAGWRAVFDAIREKARQGRSLALEDFRLITREFFHRLQSDTEKQFVILNGFITQAIAKERKEEPTGEDNGRGHAEYFESLVSRASLQRLSAWLVELAPVNYLDPFPYCYYSDSPEPDPLFEAAVRWGVDVDAIKASVADQSKSGRNRKEGADYSIRGAGRRCRPAPFSAFRPRPVAVLVKRPTELLGFSGTTLDPGDYRPPVTRSTPDRLTHLHGSAYNGDSMGHAILTEGF